MTPSESRLFESCIDLFGSDSCYSSPFRSQGNQNGAGDGKELCDVLVRFGCHLIIFSDKDYPQILKPETISRLGHATVWRRWERSAITASFSQLRGARRWVIEHPSRLFKDRLCCNPLDNVMNGVEKIHMVAVARGAGAESAVHFDNATNEKLFSEQFDGYAMRPAAQSVSLMQEYGNAEELADDEKLFIVNVLNEKNELVHLIDEVVFDVLFGIFTTPMDFLNYLTEKEEIFRRHKYGIVAGEDDLIASYFSTMASTGRPGFTFRTGEGTTQDVGHVDLPDEEAIFVVKDGLYDQLTKSNFWKDYCSRSERWSSHFEALLTLDMLKAIGPPLVTKIKALTQGEINELGSEVEQLLTTGCTDQSIVWRVRLLNASKVNFVFCMVPKGMLEKNIKRFLIKLSAEQIGFKDIGSTIRIGFVLDRTASGNNIHVVAVVHS